jgi:multidrug efflux pump subunit AcrB
MRFQLTYSPEKTDSCYAQLMVDVDDYRKIDAMVDKLQKHLDGNFPDAMCMVKKFLLGPGGGGKIQARFRGQDPVGLLSASQPFGFMALLGLLSLIGMLIKNAVVLIDQIDLKIREGKGKYLAVLDSSASRMRPVMMAAATTVLGMTPLVLDAFYVSMAVTIMFGLTFAAILTLIVVPTLYSIFFRIDRNDRNEGK